MTACIGDRKVMNRKRIVTKHSIALGLAAAVLCVIGAISISFINQQRHAEATAVHTYEVLARLNHTFEQILDAEAGQRGYLITGKEEYLSSYYAALVQIELDLTELKAETSDNQFQQLFCEKLVPVVEDKLLEMKNTIELRRNYGFDAAATVILSGQDKRRMDRIRKVIGEMEKEEYRLLAERRETVKARGLLVTLTVLIGLPVGMITMGAIGYLTSRSNVRHEIELEAKNRFLANMSHEIRTPMNAIIGFSDLLTLEELTEDQLDYVNTISNSGKHLLSLINDILDFSKIEAGRMKVERIECSLKKILDNIYAMAKFKAEEKGIEFGVHAFKDFPEKMRTDPSRLSQCLINLVNNAIKFTDEGHVYLNVSLEQRDRRQFVRFDVEDTGIGIPADRQDAIFESFTQADNSTTRKFGGTGLGLAITKQLALLLGGELSIISEVGRGSVFTLLIPVGYSVPARRAKKVLAKQKSGS